MSNLPGNPHSEAWKDESDGQWGVVQATLALAYEQRTANLIALLDTPAGRLAFMGEPDDAMGAVQEEIRERLGLRAEK